MKKLRHSAEVQALKRFVDAGELGGIYSARVTALRRRGIPGNGASLLLETSFALYIRKKSDMNVQHSHQPAGKGRDWC